MQAKVDVVRSVAWRHIRRQGSKVRCQTMAILVYN